MAKRAHQLERKIQRLQKGSNTHDEAQAIANQLLGRLESDLMAHHNTLLRDPHFQALWMDKGDGQGNAGTTD
jgi:hypothetical protein